MEAAEDRRGKRTGFPDKDTIGIRRARMLDGGIRDLLISDGVWVSIGEGVADQAKVIWEAEENLLISPFVDAHFHLDSVYAIDETGENVSGTLLEGIEMWGKYKFRAAEEAILSRASRYCERAIEQGIRAIRSHVDVSVPGLPGVRALLRLREVFSDRLDIQLVAFPQDGYYRCPGNRERLLEALNLGVDMVGGIPHHERTPGEGAASIRELIGIAKERGLMVDFHCDETDDPASRHVETVAFETLRQGMVGRVAVSHLTSLHSVDEAWFNKLLPLMMEADLKVIANPLINIVLQGRADGYPKRRGLTRVKEFFAAGVDLAFGHDCVQDPWYPFGDGDMLDVARMGIHAGHLTGTGEWPLALGAVTDAPARILGLPGSDIKVGAPAHGLILAAKSLRDTLSAYATRALLIRGNRVIRLKP